MTRFKRAVYLALGLLLLFGTGLGAVTDTTPPVIAIFTPADGSSYILRQPEIVLWVVVDPEPSSGIKFVSATAPDGSPLDTNTVGGKDFTVAAVDNAGNAARRTAHYWVIYRTQAMEPVPQSAFAPGKIPQLEAKAGQAIPFSFAVQDFFAATVSNAVGTLSVLDSQTHAVVAIEKNIIGIFGYDSTAGLYRYALDTSTLKPGNYDVLVQFDDTRTIYRLALKVDASS
jgi:hypothetical protein